MCIRDREWTDDQAAKIREIIGAEYKVEGDLRSEIQLNIKRLMDKVVVTDGTAFALTSEDGSYMIDADEKAHFIYVVTPSGYMAPCNAADFSSWAILACSFSYCFIRS